MAEIFGVVASGLAVAEVGLKVGGTVWKLKRLWQEVHGVPETIQDLMRQIEMMDPILSDHETNLGIQSTASLRQRPNHSSAPAMLSAVYCREALNDLRCLVKDLDVAVASEKRRKRAVARMKVVLKKDTIKGFQDRLERAMRLLQSTQMSNLVANAKVTGAMVTEMWTTITAVQVQQKLILQQLSDTKDSGSIGREPYPAIYRHDGTSQEHILVKQKGAKHYQGRSAFPHRIRPSILGYLMVQRTQADSTGEATYAARIQLPKWLSRKAWDISVTRACSGWQATLATWNMVPNDSPGIRCAIKGDLDGLIDLFNRGLASPTDYDVSGYTIFRVCPIFSITPILKMGMAIDQIKLACLFSHTHIVKHFINMSVVRSDITAMNIFMTMAIVEGRIPLDILQPLLSDGSFLEPLFDAAQDLEVLPEPTGLLHGFSVLCLSAVVAREQDLLDLYLQTCFPFWHNLCPRRKMEILSFDFSLGNWPADVIRRLICPNSPIRPIDAQVWIDDSASLLYVVLSSYLRPPVKAGDGKWDTLLREAIKATDDMHCMLESPNNSFGIRGTRSVFESALVFLLKPILSQRRHNWDKKTRRRGLKELTTNLQSLMSVLASCGHDLLEFGRREAVVWAEGDTTRIVGDVLDFGICDSHRWCRDVRGVHYGAEPRDWYFEMGCPYEKYFGAFWNMVENPYLFMVPGAWVYEEWDSDWA